MKLVHLPTAPAAVAAPGPVDVAHEQASLIAQLALRSTFTADFLEYLRRMLTKYSPSQILAALDLVQAELVAEGHSPDFPAGDDAQSLLLLDAGLRRLERFSPLVGASFQPLLAAA